MVYMHYIASKPAESGSGVSHATWIAISPDRNTADTLFRILQDCQGKPLQLPGAGSGGAIMTPVGVERLSPQLWVLQAEEGAQLIASLSDALAPHAHGMGPGSLDSALSSVAGKIFIYPLEQHLNPGAALQPCENEHDYLSGHSFFIRRCGYPNTFWYCCGNLICLSTTKRSRFCVSIAQRTSSTNTPLVDQDEVAIEWVDCHERKRVVVENNDWLTVKANGSRTFRFSDFQRRFYLGNEGTGDNPDPLRLGATLDAVCWSSKHAFQDSFELCYGVAPGD
ncbi:hypothetical protein BJX63DRAFT_55904 [Aspergillus granulosus]|uniref:Uncharacterized protein n=1 Tax=Aspergillus granulosus TaxID=176169 RepID=A0ABR4GXJ9_9EURO